MAKLDYTQEQEYIKLINRLEEQHPALYGVIRDDIIGLQYNEMDWQEILDYLNDIIAYCLAQKALFIDTKIKLEGE